MTVIVWDGRTLAADKLSTCGGLACTVTKIRRVGTSLVGFSGNADQGMEMLAWVRGGCKPTKFPESQRNSDDWAAVMVIRPGGRIQQFERTPYAIEYEDKTYAIGSGRDFALAAMHLGKTAKEAVEIASLFDPGCGGGVDELKFK